MNDNETPDRRKAPVRLDPELEFMIKETHLLLTNKDVGVCSRVRALEHTVNGNGKPGIAETVRELRRTNARSAAFVSGGVSFALAAAIAWLEHKLGGK